MRAEQLRGEAIPARARMSWVLFALHGWGTGRRKTAATCKVLKNKRKAQARRRLAASRLPNPIVRVKVKIPRIRKIRGHRLPIAYYTITKKVYKRRQILGDQSKVPVVSIPPCSFCGKDQDSCRHLAGLKHDGTAPEIPDHLMPDAYADEDGNPDPAPLPCQWVMEEFLETGAGGDIQNGIKPTWKEALCLGPDIKKAAKGVMSIHALRTQHLRNTKHRDWTLPAESQLDLRQRHPPAAQNRKHDARWTARNPTATPKITSEAQKEEKATLAKLVKNRREALRREALEHHQQETRICELQLPQAPPAHRIDDVDDDITREDAEVLLAITPQGDRILIGPLCHLRHTLWKYGAYLYKAQRKELVAALRNLLNDSDTWAIDEDEEYEERADGNTLWTRGTTSGAMKRIARRGRLEPSRSPLRNARRNKKTCQPSKRPNRWAPGL